MDRLGAIAWVEGDLVSACVGVSGHDERSRRECDENGECFTSNEWKKAKPRWGSVSNRRAAIVFLSSKLGCRLEAWGIVRLVESQLRSLKLHLGLLLVVFLPPLFLCWYYFNYFQWTHCQPTPADGLTYVTDVDAPQLNEFRKRTVSSVTDPLRQQLEKLQEIRKRTNGGNVRYPGLEQDILEVRNRLKEIMTEARLRRIPKKFKSNYETALRAIQDAFYSANTLEDAFEQETDRDRQHIYAESVKLWERSREKCDETREFFASDEWQKVR